MAPEWQYFYFGCPLENVQLINVMKSVSLGPVFEKHSPLCRLSQAWVCTAHHVSALAVLVFLHGMGESGECIADSSFEGTLTEYWLFRKSWNLEINHENLTFFDMGPFVFNASQLFIYYSMTLYREDLA